MTKKTKVALLAFLAAVVVIGGVYFLFLAPSGDNALKEITVIVLAEDEELSNQTVETTAEFLAEVLEAEEIASGDTGEFGLFITQAGGVTADSSKEQWWGIQVNGEDAQFGASDLVLVDGDVYTLTLNTGY